MGMILAYFHEVGKCLYSMTELKISVIILTTYSGGGYDLRVQLYHLDQVALFFKDLNWARTSYCGMKISSHGEGEKGGQRLI